LSEILFPAAAVIRVRLPARSDDVRELTLIVIHIGFAKTATTTLQDVFMRSRSTGYIGKGLRDRAATPCLSVEVARAVFFSDTERFRHPPSSRDG